MSIPDKAAWPKTPEGTTDWEVLFEHPNTGLVGLVSATEDPEQLKELAVTIIRTVFNRKRDKPIIAKVDAFLDKLIPPDADEDGFPTMKAGVKQMLRKVKEDRIKKATAFERKSKSKKAQKKTTKKVNRRANPIVDFFKESNAAKAVLVVSLAAMLPLGIYLGSPERTTAKGDVLEHIRWIDDYVFNHLPNDSWILQSVQKSKESQIAIEVLVMDQAHINLIKGMKRMARVALLNQVCPHSESGVREILDQGWSLWVVLNSEDELLTGGTCHY